MNCLKCGVEVANNQCFCDDCMTDMQRHPVQPGTPLILPKRDKLPPAKRSYRKIRKPEDVILAQRRVIGLLLAVIIILAGVLAFAVVSMLHFRDLAQLAEPAVDQIVSRETIFDNL